MRVALRLAYDGSAFDSYARQPGRRTVEGALMAALLHEGLAEGGLRTGSRTDAGVSALENVVAAELQRPHVRGLVPALQARLPAGLWVTAAAQTPDTFDPRRAAWREYTYLAAQAGEDEGAMAEAAQAFVGDHDVRAFARVEAGRTPLRTVLACSVRGEEGGEPGAAFWVLRVRGQSFLWNQVRRMASAVLAVGRGEAEAEDVRQALATGRAHARFGLAPAEGLRLERVHYDGLGWDPAAGALDARRVTPFAVASQTRAALARHLSSVSRGALD